MKIYRISQTMGLSENEISIDTLKRLFPDSPEKELEEDPSKKVLITVANVGGTESDNDVSRLDMVAKWLIDNDTGISPEAKFPANIVFQSDNINLPQRDFLEENKTYDIVVLHAIYNPTHKGEESLDKGIFSRSKKHTPEEWKRRLVSTAAKYIFVFGGYTEVAAWWLKSIPGYDYESDYRYDLGIYKQA